MNLKAATKYQIYDYIKSIRIFYLVVFLVIVFFGTIASVSSSGNFQGMGSIEWSAMIFLFVLGLNSFKETFLMMLQNSTSRKMMFISRLITIGITSASMAVIDRIIVNLAGLISNANERFEIGGMYEMLFDKRAASMNIVLLNLEAILITITVYVAAIIAGYFITTAYYRMNKLWKTVVSIGLPSTFLVLLPLLDVAAFDGKVSAAIQKIIIFVFGGKTGNPYNLFLSCILFSAVGIGLSWLLIRKAVEKN